LEFLRHDGDFGQRHGAKIGQQIEQKTGKEE
jgi:hypothetical protein